MRDFEQTAIVPCAIAQRCLKSMSLTQPQQLWFIGHVDARIRRDYAAKAPWTLRLTRERVYAFVTHWLKAFCIDPVAYKDRHEYP